MQRGIEKKIPVGIEKFEKIRTEGFYYIDKTAFIHELLYSWGEVNLFTRPRRFGKTLNMDMLKTFFEIGTDASLFAGLAIAEEQELCRKYMGQFPVVFLSLKSIEGADFESAKKKLSIILRKEVRRFQFLLESDRLTDVEKSLYSQLIMVGENNSFNIPDTILMGSLYTLSALLKKHYGLDVIILIDEYDVPLAKANENGYYDQMVMLIRNMFDQALKTNGNLKFAVLTGCLRIAKESIFTGLNNMKVLSVTDVRFDEYFGFMDAEVQEMLKYYGLSDHYDTIKEWYDGYRFGKTEVYCPWDVLCYCDALLGDRSASPEAYWSNTSGNEAIRHFLEQAGSVTRWELEQLIAGGTVSQRPRCKHTGHQISSDASIGVLDPRGSRQMDMPACPLGSLPAGIKKGIPKAGFQLPGYLLASLSLSKFFLSDLKKLLCILSGSLHYSLIRNSLYLSNGLCHISKIHRTVPLPSVGFRGQIRGICLQEQIIQRSIFYYFLQTLSVLKSNYSSHSQVITHVHVFPGMFFGIRIAVDHSPEIIRPLGFHNIQRILCSVPAVDNDGQSCLFCQIHLPDKPFFLDLMVFFIPVVIQADLPYGGDLLPVAVTPQFLHILFRKISYFIRMDPHCSINKWILFREGYGISHSL